ncbi:MAG: DUF4266 domain-containing protein [Gemmatimonadota bacterium]
MKHSIPFTIALLAGLLAGACTSVSPWERETLASPRMALDPEADEQAMTQSRRRTREEGHVGSSGSSASGSAGGCGCN